MYIYYYVKNNKMLKVNLTKQQQDIKHEYYG